MIGKMRHKITGRGLSQVSVGGGGTKKLHTEVLTDWCEIKPLTSSRDLAEYQTVLNGSKNFIMRVRCGFTPDKSMLIVHNGQNYTVNGVIEIDERDRFWKITGVMKE